nr:IclR family transcriptional regulator [uncultured Celeribacter sp.]
MDRAVQILDRLANSATPLGVSELARDLEAPKSSLYGICETLVAAGVLHSDGSGYALGAHCLRWSAGYLDRSSLVSEFQRILSKDSRLAQFTVTLSTLEKADVVYLACSNADKPLGFTFQIGMRLPAVYSATGKAMLSCLPKSERHDILSAPWQPPFTENSVTTLEAFDDAAELWHRQGYAVDNGEIREGMVCLGAPILDPAGKPVAGIAISMTSAEARPEVQKELGGIVRDIANALKGH